MRDRSFPLATASQSKYQVKGRFLLDVVVRKSPAVFQLFPGKDKTLLVWRNAFLVLNFGLHCVNRIRRLDLQSNGLSSQSLMRDKVCKEFR